MAEAAPANAGARRILVVDDSTINARVTVLMLERLGCAAESVHGGTEAVAATARAAYDLVLMDCEMPGMDGFAATRAIRAREAGGRRVPVVALTGHVRMEQRSLCLEAGMDDLLMKPVQMAELEAALAKWIGGAAAK